VKETFEDCDVMTQSMLIAYNQIRDHEDDERYITLIKSNAGRL